MKLIVCIECNDVVRLISTRWRKCYCKKSGGQYNKDLMSATIGGSCEVLGISNLFFNEDFKNLSEKEKVKFRKKHKLHWCEIWWGENPGDQQIHRIKSPDGPRLNVKLEEIDDEFVKVIFKDRRKYTINLENPRPKFVIVENNLKALYSSFEDKKNKKWIKNSKIS